MVGAGTIRRLEDAGLCSLVEVAELDVDELVELGVQPCFAVGSSKESLSATLPFTNRSPPFTNRSPALHFPVARLVRVLRTPLVGRQSESEWPLSLEKW